MARTYTIQSVEPDSANKENIRVIVEVTDGDEKFPITMFAHDLTPDRVAQIIGIKEANVLQSRKEGLAALKAQVGQPITPIAPEVITPNEAQQTYSVAVQKVIELTGLVQLKIVAEDDAEYVAAIQAAKDARTALKG